jgi:hypothetical protein
MYIIHNQGGYFGSIARMVEEALGQPCKYSTNPNEHGTWVLFFTSYLSGFHTKINDPYILVQTEPHDRVFDRYPNYKIMHDKAIKVLDFTSNLQIGYSTSYRLECEGTKDIDVLFYGVLSNRRKKILDSIKVNNKVILSTSPPIHGIELWKYINNSKIVLNISSYDNRKEPDWIRLAPLLSNRSFVITEEIDNEEFMALKDHIIISDYESIKLKVDFFLNNPIERIVASDKGFDFIRKFRRTKIL